MVREDALVKEFVASYIAEMGGVFEEIAPGVFRAELSREASAELEGTTWGLWHSPDDRAHATYYFTFDADRVDAVADTELVVPGSHRLEQMIASVRRLTRGFQAWLPAYECVERMAWQPRYVYYRPFFLFLMKLQTNGGHTPIPGLSVAVDRVDQVALRHLADALPGLPLMDGAPPQSDAAPKEEPLLSLDLAFGLAFDELLTQLEQASSEWADAQRFALESEKYRLMEFFAARERDGDDVSEERNRRLEELEEMMPRVRVEVQSIGDLSLPVTYDENGGVRHLAFELF